MADEIWGVDEFSQDVLFYAFNAIDAVVRVDETHRHDPRNGNVFRVTMDDDSVLKVTVVKERG